MSRHCYLRKAGLSASLGDFALFSAKQSNATCKAFFDRLVAKWKNGKVALVAVCNELLKQACAIVHSAIPYQAKFRSKLAPIS